MNIKLRNLKNQNNAQLLLLAGITISITIITLSTVAANLSTNATVPFDKTSFIKTDYNNIRSEFGKALRDNLYNKLEYSESSVRRLIWKHFNYTKENFIFYIETIRGNSFNVELLEFRKDHNEDIYGILIRLTMSNGEEFITEDIFYDLR